MSHWSDTLAVFDTETTGLSPRDDRIVTAFLGVMGPDGELVERFSWLADPGVVIPPRATEVHGITTKMAQEQGRNAAEVVSEVVKEIRRVLDAGIPLVVYNASYDLTLTNWEARRYGVEPLDNPRPIIDPLVIDRALDTYRKGKRTLDVVSMHYGIINDHAHNAEGDAVTAGRVARAMVQKFPDDTADLTALHDAQVDWAYRWAESFRRYLESQGRPAQGLGGRWPVDE
ncbi:MAG: exonuclease domain-containing protein [Pontimonas sp.]